MTNIIQELDVWNVLVNETAGNELLFIFLTLLVVGYAASKFKLSDFATILVLMVFGILFSTFFSSLLIITLYALGIMITYYLIRFINPRT